MKKLQNALVICIAGRTIEHLKQHGHLDSLEKVMLGDRIFDRAEIKEMVVLDEMTKANIDRRNKKWIQHLELVQEISEKF
jgi:hypothetical protein